MTYWGGVALQVRVDLAQVEQIRLLHVAGLGPGSVQDGCSMALETERIVFEDNSNTKDNLF